MPGVISLTVILYFSNQYTLVAINPTCVVRFPVHFIPPYRLTSRLTTATSTTSTDKLVLSPSPVNQTSRPPELKPQLQPPPLPSFPPLAPSQPPPLPLGPQLARAKRPLAAVILRLRLAQDLVLFRHPLDADSTAMRLQLIALTGRLWRSWARLQSLAVFWRCRKPYDARCSGVDHALHPKNRLLVRTVFWFCVSLEG